MHKARRNLNDLTYVSISTVYQQPNKSLVGSRLKDFIMARFYFDPGQNWGYKACFPGPKRLLERTTAGLSTTSILLAEYRRTTVSVYKIACGTLFWRIVLHEFMAVEC